MKTKMKTRNKEPTWESEYQTPHSLNIRGVYLHILEHFLASIIVIVSTVIVIFYKDKSWTAYVDPGFTLLVVCTILYSTIPLFRETLILFMQSVPANIKVKDLEERLIKQVPKVLSVHEFHVWQLGGGDQVVGTWHISAVFEFRYLKHTRIYILRCSVVQFWLILVTLVWLQLNWINFNLFYIISRE